MKAKPPIDPPAPRAGFSVQRDNRETKPERRRRRAADGRRTIQPSNATVLVATVDDQLRVPSASDEAIAYEYKGHVIRVERQRIGWRAAIYPENSPFALRGGAYTPEAAGRDAVVEQAKAIIDKQSADEPAAGSDAAATTADPRRSNSIAGAFFVRLRNYLARGWVAARNIYFSVDQPPRRHC
jgi:hypothetical protein